MSHNAHEALNIERTAFWQAFAQEAPALNIVASAGQNKEVPLALEGKLKLVFSLSQGKTSVYLAGRSPAAKLWIARHEAALARHLPMMTGQARKEAAANRWFRRDTLKADVTQRSQWPQMTGWLIAQHEMFKTAVSHIKDA